MRSYDTIIGECAIPIKEKDFVKMGNIDDLDDDSIIVGQRLGASMGIGVGDEVEIFSPTMLNKIKKDEVPMPARLRVVGLLATDYSEVDSNIALVSLRRLRDLYNLGEGSHSVILRLKDGADCELMAREISENLRYPMRAITWLTNNAAFLRIIKMEKVMMSLIIVLIIIVASFLFAFLFTRQCSTK
ncbi:MAG: ABC transporter permease [Bacilli bacterium]